eukprot:jgi/Chrpa1/17715/Chrysochromulina_OHIO_Genome00022058-RA
MPSSLPSSVRNESGPTPHGRRLLEVKKLFCVADHQPDAAVLTAASIIATSIAASIIACAAMSCLAIAKRLSRNLSTSV